MYCELHACRQMLSAFCLGWFYRGRLQEPLRAAYNVRGSCCAFMDEALLWHADCAGASFQQLCCSCTPHATKALRLYPALYMPFLSPPELHQPTDLSAPQPVTDSRYAYKTMSSFLSLLTLYGRAVHTGVVSHLTRTALDIRAPHLSREPSSGEHVPPSEPILPSGHRVYPEKTFSDSCWACEASSALMSSLIPPAASIILTHAGWIQPAGKVLSALALYLAEGLVIWQLPHSFH